MKLFKVLFTLALIILFYNNAFSQIPNAGFENWTDGEPDNWFTDNFSFIGAPVTQSSDSHTGSSAIKIGVVSSVGGNYPGYIGSGEGIFDGFPVSQAHGSLIGYYKFNGSGDDICSITVTATKDGSYNGAGSAIINTSTNVYTQFVVPIEYFQQPQVPDTLSIFISLGDSSNGMVSLETYILIDDLAFGGTVGVNDRVSAAETFQLKQNYPNPFNPSTTIEFSVPEESSVDLKVYNILGVEVASLASGNYSPGNYKVNFNGENLASGIYLAKITATAEATRRTFSKTVKMTLLK